MALFIINKDVEPDENGFAEYEIPSFQGGLIYGFVGLIEKRDIDGSAQSSILGNLDDMIQICFSEYQGGKYFTIYPRTKFDQGVKNYGKCKVRFEVQEGGTLEIHTFPPGQCPLSST